MNKAVIFDMDGVLINSEVEYLELYKQLFDESKISITPEEFAFIPGCSSTMENEFLANKFHVSIEEADALKHRFFAKHPLDYAKIRKPYVVEFLEYLKQKGITIALASSSPMANINHVLDVCEIGQYFTYKISGEMFKESKPNPEIYEYTCKQLGINKNEILVVEDSTYGITAAKRAGLKVCAVYDPVLRFDVAQADYVVSNLEEVKSIV